MKTKNTKLLSSIGKTALALLFAGAILTNTACGAKTDDNQQTQETQTATPTDSEPKQEVVEEKETQTPSETTGATAETTSMIKLKVGASPVPHAVILESVKEQLAKEGIDLEIVQFTDYVIPNLALDEKSLDANFFQHEPYLIKFNAENKIDLISVAAIHYEPMGIFAGKTAKFEDLKDGATIAVPNDATNEARALQLLAAQGLIVLDESAGLNATKASIKENPKNLDIYEIEAAQVPLILQDVDMAVVNGNYALSANLDPTTALASEASDSEAAKTYANILVVRNGDENRPEIQALIKALTSQETKDFINKTYQNLFVPVF